MIKNVVFDLGGVLIDWNPKYVYRTIFDTEEKVDWFLNNITLYEWNIEQDRGRTLADATDFLVEKHPEYIEEIKAYYGRWTEMLGGPIGGTVDILKEVLDSKKYRVLALTNWSAETFPIAQELYEFLSWFEGTVVSGVEKCIKPERKIYQILLERFNLKAEETIFIDDSEKNVEGGEQLGIKGIHFKSPDQLRADLEKLYVL